MHRKQNQGIITHEALSLYQLITGQYIYTIDAKNMLTSKPFAYFNNTMSLNTKETFMHKLLNIHKSDNIINVQPLLCTLHFMFRLKNAQNTSSTWEGYVYFFITLSTIRAITVAITAFLATCVSTTVTSLSFNFGFAFTFFLVSYNIYSPFSAYFSSPLTPIKE